MRRQCKVGGNSKLAREPGTAALSRAFGCCGCDLTTWLQLRIRTEEIRGRAKRVTAREVRRERWNGRRCRCRMCFERVGHCEGCGNRATMLSKFSIAPITKSSSGSARASARSPMGCPASFPHRVCTLPLGLSLAGAQCIITLDYRRDPAPIQDSSCLPLN